MAQIWAPMPTKYQEPSPAKWPSLMAARRLTSPMVPSLSGIQKTFRSVTAFKKNLHGEIREGFFIGNCINHTHVDTTTKYYSFVIFFRKDWMPLLVLKINIGMPDDFTLPVFEIPAIIEKYGLRG